MSMRRNFGNTNNNARYYNQMLRAAEKKVSKQRQPKNFGSQEIDFSDYLIIPRGYEGISYTFYIIAIPYLIGLSFLFLYVAEGVYGDFSLLDLNSFLIIWAIGYEITGALILLFIFLAYLKFLKNSHY